MKNILCLFSAIVLFSACTDKPESARTFKPEDFQPRFESQVSSVPFPLHISFVELEELINRALPLMVLDDSLYDGGQVENVKIQLKRTGDVKLKRKGNRLHLRVPLEADVQPRLSRSILGINFSASPKVKASFFLNMTTTVDFSEKYEIITDLKVEEIEWIESPSLRVALLDISITKAVERLLEERGPQLEKGLNAAVKQSVNLKEPIAKIWKDMHKPVRINKKFQEAYLIPLPVGLQLGSVEIENDGLLAWLELEAYITTFVGADTTHAEAAPLPPLMHADSMRTDFDIHFYVSIPLSEVGEILREEFAGKDIDVSGTILHIKHLEFHTTPDKLLVETDITSPATAALLFEGSVLFDPFDTAVAATDFEFLLLEGNDMAYAADAVLHQIVLDAIGHEFRLPLGNLIHQIAPLVENAIEKGKLGEKIYLGLDSVHLEPTIIILRPDTILLNVHGTGKASLHILDLKPQEKATSKLQASGNKN